MSDKVQEGGNAESPVYDTLLANRYLKIYDLKNAPGGHYFEASRREGDRITAFMGDNAFKTLLPDAVTVAVILEDFKTSGEVPAGGAAVEPRLLLNYEFRYPVGRELLSPPAGLIDPGDAVCADGDNTSGAAAANASAADEPAAANTWKLPCDPVLRAAAREIFEETGLRVRKGDRLFKVTQAAFSSPGMTDESNAVACAVLKGHSAAELSHSGAEGTEAFGEFELVTLEQARSILKAGADSRGNWFSAYTWIVLLYFVSEMWRE